MFEKIFFLLSYLRTCYLKNHFSSRENLLKWQQKKMIKHIALIRRKSTFYKTLWKGIPDSKWMTFPIIDKLIMMENFNTLNTADIDKDRAFEVALRSENTRDFSPSINNHTIGLSSGTSGHRGLFLVSKREQNEWAGTALAKLLPDPIWKKARIAFFLRANSNLYQSVSKGKIQLHYFDMLVPLSEHYKKLEILGPTIIIAPPQVLINLAKEIVRGNLKLNPRKILSVAETLDPLDELTLRKSFNCKIHQVYQATEGFLGISCDHGTIHINEDLVHVEKEFLDKESGRFIPIITDFRRISQPIVRYRLNDILTEKKSPCACGSHFMGIEQIEGRTDDIFFFISENDPSKYCTVFPDFVRRFIIMTTTPIIQYMVFQDSPEKMLVHLELEKADSKKEIEEEITKNLVELCKTIKAKIPELSFEYFFPDLNSKKLRRVVRRFDKKNISLY